MTVFVYVNTGKQVGDPDHIKVFVVWVEDNNIVGFSAADPRDGSIFALFVEEAYERRGIGRALFERACKVLDEPTLPACG